MESIKYDTNELIYKIEQIHRHREQTCGCQGEGERRDGLGVWDSRCKTIIYRMDKQQGPIV